MLSRQCRKSQDGFTAVELLLIMALMAILYYVFVPKYTLDAARKPQTLASAQALAGDLRYTQQLSMNGGPNGNSGKLYCLKFYNSGTATDTWKIFAQDSESAPIKTVTLTPGMNVASVSTDSFYFDTTGLPYPATGGNVVISDPQGTYSWRVSVVKTTGRVMLTEM